MIRLNKILKQTILFCLIISYGIYLYKPNIMFNDNNEFKKFGLKRDETIYPFWLVIIISSFMFHYMCLLNGVNYI